MFVLNHLLSILVLRPLKYPKREMYVDIKHIDKHNLVTKRAKTVARHVSILF